MDKQSPYISEQQQEEFEHFLLGQMTMDEERIFKEKLKGDRKTLQQFEEFKEMFHAIEENKLRNALEGFHRNFQAEKSAKTSNFNRYRIAAGIAILIAIGLWFFNQPGQNEELFKDYFRPDPGLPTVMGNNENYAFYEAMVDYKRANYKNAIAKWEKQLAAKPDNDTLNYFLGVAHLANENVDNAIKFLSPLSNNRNSAFYDEINTYLGLALLKKGEIADAKSNLAKSSTKTSKEILAQLK